MEGAGSGKSLSAVDANVQKERALLIDATIVRIMKARKVEAHSELIADVIKHIKLF